MSRQLKEQVPKFKSAGYTVDLEETTLTVNDIIVDCAEYPICNIYLDEPVSLNIKELFNWFQLRKLLEQAEAVEAKVSEIDKDEGEYMVKFRFDTTIIPDRVLKAWGFVPQESLEVAVDVNLANLTLQNIRIVSKGSKPESLDMLTRLIQILKPSKLSEVPTAVGYFKVLNHFCCICCRTHPPEMSDMLLLFPCRNLLCIYTSQIIGFSTRISSLGLKLLAFLFQAAVNSTREALVCQPFPTLFESDNRVLLHPTEKRDIPLAKDFAEQLVKMDFSSFPESLLAHWLSVSNKTLLITIPESPIQGAHSFLTLAASPEKMVDFQREKAIHGSIFAFHGSSLENWHRILHDGLKNASGTALMTTGAAYGPGIYLSPDFAVSIGYSRYSAGMSCIAICEIIDAEIRKPQHNIWVCANEAHVQIRYLFWFETANAVPFQNRYNTTDPEFSNLLRTTYEKSSN